MKIGLLTTSYPRYSGDYRGVFVKRLVDELTALGTEVRVIEPRGFDVLKRGSGLIPNLQKSSRAKLLFPFYCLSFLFLAVKNAWECDLLHANWSLSGFFAVMAGRLTRRKVILTERSKFLIDSESRMINRVLLWIMRRCDVVVTISEAGRERLNRKFREIEICVIPNGVDEALFTPGNRSQRKEELGLERSCQHIVWAGRLTQGKRLDVLLRALGAVAGAGHDFRCWILGDGELNENITGELQGDDVLKSKVTLMGRCDQTEVARWFGGADLFVSCSEGEGGGNALLEAMSSGLACVSTPVGWAEDYLIDGANGVISPVGDADALAEKITSLLQAPEHAQNLGRNARATIAARQLTWNGCARAYVDLYEGMLEGEPR